MLVTTNVWVKSELILFKSLWAVPSNASWSCSKLRQTMIKRGKWNFRPNSKWRRICIVHHLLPWIKIFELAWMENCTALSSWEKIRALHVTKNRQTPSSDPGWPAIWMLWFVLQVWFLYNKLWLYLRHRGKWMVEAMEKWQCCSSSCVC